MFDLGSLDIIISIVVVLLVLSLIAQSIQALLKKLLKMKSKKVMESMIDLFKYIDTSKLVDRTPEQLVDDVAAQFKQLGRVSRFKNPMLDSISKGDLLKVLAKLHGDKLKAEVENWFDTVMQGFEERYNRHMKTVAIVVSFLVVILLNANIFKIYRNLAEGDVQRAAIVQSGEVLLERLQKQENKTAPTTTPTATPTPAANQSEDQVKEIKANVQELQQYVGDYKGLGFTPLTPKKVWNYASGQKEWQGIGAGVRFAYGLEVLLGWTIMALLLSVGAPFWQDVLESLFGIKGLIRQKNKTRNVEEEAGGGQTKP